MALSAGTRLGTYEVVAQIGVGGTLVFPGSLGARLNASAV